MQIFSRNFAGRDFPGKYLVAVLREQISPVYLGAAVLQEEISPGNMLSQFCGKKFPQYILPPQFCGKRFPREMCCRNFAAGKCTFYFRSLSIQSLYDRFLISGTVILWAKDFFPDKKKFINEYR